MQPLGRGLRPVGGLLWAEGWRRLGMGWGQETGDASGPPGNLGMGKAGLGQARGWAAVHDLCLSVCLSILSPRLHHLCPSLSPGSS